MCENTKSIEQLLNMKDQGYEEYVTNLAADEEGFWAIDELDDELLNVVKTQPEGVERPCRISADVFEQLPDDYRRVNFICYNFNTRLIAAIQRGNVKDAKAAFTEGIRFCRKNKHYEAGKSISQNVFGLWSLATMPNDEALYFLMQVKEFYEELGKPEDSIEVLCAAAMRFADAAAFQSAYRALADAQQIALDQKLYFIFLFLKTGRESPDSNPRLHIDPMPGSRSGRLGFARKDLFATIYYP